MKTASWRRVSSKIRPRRVLGHCFAARCPLSEYCCLQNRRFCLAPSSFRAFLVYAFNQPPVEMACSDGAFQNAAPDAGIGGTFRQPALVTPTTLPSVLPQSVHKHGSMVRRACRRPRPVDPAPFRDDAPVPSMDRTPRRPRPPGDPPPAGGSLGRVDQSQQGSGAVQQYSDGVRTRWGCALTTA